MLQTEFEFTLPQGYVDNDGNLHTTGIMRLANARDEIAPLQDPRVARNSAYLAVILLSRVIVKLGELGDVTPATVEGLFSADFSHLQDLYRRINANGHAHVSLTCPECESDFEVSETLFEGGQSPEG